MWRQALGETVRETTRNSQKDIYLCLGERRQGWKKNTRDGMKTNQESKVHGPDRPQLPMSSATGLVGATLSKHGGGHWMLSQKQCCKPTQNAPDTSKDKYYSLVLKIKSLIRYPENGSGSVLLLLPGHPGCHPALETGTQTLCWVWQCRYPGNEGMLSARGRQSRMHRDARCLYDPPSAETELWLGLTAASCLTALA